MEASSDRGHGTGIRRRSRLHACLPEVSKKVMTECLRGLERDGLVTRRIYAQVPARVEYSLTPLGWTTTEAIVAFSDWDKDHGADVTTARSEFWHRQSTPSMLSSGPRACPRRLDQKRPPSKAAEPCRPTNAPGFARPSSDELPAKKEQQNDRRHA